MKHMNIDLWCNSKGLKSMNLYIKYMTIISKFVKSFKNFRRI